jgi:hypothetical protein
VNGDKLHKPNEVGGSLVATDFTYAAAGYAVGKYLGLPLCATPPVYPCKTQAINDRLVAANRAAFQAVLAANAAGATQAQKDAVVTKQKALADEAADPEVQKQLKLLDAKNGGAP